MRRFGPSTALLLCLAGLVPGSMAGAGTLHLVHELSGDLTNFAFPVRAVGSAQVLLSVSLTADGFYTPVDGPMTIHAIDVDGTVNSGATRIRFGLESPWTLWAYAFGQTRRGVPSLGWYPSHANPYADLHPIRGSATTSGGAVIPFAGFVRGGTWSLPLPAFLSGGRSGFAFLHEVRITTPIAGNSGWEVSRSCWNCEIGREISRTFVPEPTLPLQALAAIALVLTALPWLRRSRAA